MENKLQIYENNDFGQVRTLTLNGEPWFVGKDVAEILGYSNPRKAMADHVDSEDKTDGVTIRDSIGRKQNPILINESGLYSLVLRSQMPEAKKFKRWITHEVIPDIRKHGVYMTPEVMEQVLFNPDTIIRIATDLKEAREERDALAVQNAIMKPKADYFDELVDRNFLTNFRTTAKLLGVGQKEFISYLIDHGYVYRNRYDTLMPYDNKNDGLFEVKELFSRWSRWAGCQTFITPKGRETFRLLLKSVAS